MGSGASTNGIGHTPNRTHMQVIRSGRSRGSIVFMDECEVGRFWEENAEVWTMLARQGYDRYRDLLNTPAFLELLPDVTGMRGLDVGCGEGHNTRLLADRGAEMWAVDIAPAFVGYARE